MVSFGDLLGVTATGKEMRKNHPSDAQRCVYRGFLLTLGSVTAETSLFYDAGVKCERRNSPRNTPSHTNRDHSSSSHVIPTMNTLFRHSGASGNWLNTPVRFYIQHGDFYGATERHRLVRIYGGAFNDSSEGFQATHARFARAKLHSFIDRDVDDALQVGLIFYYHRYHKSIRTQSF